MEKQTDEIRARIRPTTKRMIRNGNKNSSIRLCKNSSHSEVPFFQSTNKADEVCSWYWWSRLNRYYVIHCARNLEFHSSTLPSNSQRCQEYEPKSSCSYATYAISSQEPIILWLDNTSVYKILIWLRWFWVLFHEPEVVMLLEHCLIVFFL